MKTLHQAMQKYEADKKIDSTVVEGWASGVILGQAIKNAYHSNPNRKDLTSADLIKGLGQIKNETFGGLTPPLTFTDQGDVKPSTCYFKIKVVNGKWTAPNGMQPTCLPKKVQPTLAKARKALPGS
jgi:branched-chain amino acid transport system substrate-binding protein